MNARRTTALSVAGHGAAALARPCAPIPGLMTTQDGYLKCET
jgi:hypothetical protein